MVEWYLRVITIDDDEHTLTSLLPHPVRAKLVAKRGYFLDIVLILTSTSHIKVRYSQFKKKNLIEVTRTNK